MLTWARSGERRSTRSKVSLSYTCTPELGGTSHIPPLAGGKYLDIREFYGDDNDLKPGKKGISITQEQVRKLDHAYVPFA